MKLLQMAACWIEHENNLHYWSIWCSISTQISEKKSEAFYSEAVKLRTAIHLKYSQFQEHAVFVLFFQGDGGGEIESDS